jgi:putative transposase
LGVSESGYYAWRKRTPSRRAQRDAALRLVIRAAHARSEGTYGAPRILEDLRDAGHHVGRKRVARLMRQEGVQGVSKRRGPARPRRSIPEAPPAPDLVKRTFRATAPNQLWVADITYIPTAAGFLYLAIVLDVFSRRIVGWCMRDTLHTQVVLEALDMAAAQRRVTHVVHHSDQGSQGGFNRSSQHLQPRGVYGATRRMDEASDRAGGDALSWGSFAPTRGRASVLGADCYGCH